MHGKSPVNNQEGHLTLFFQIKNKQKHSIFCSYLKLPILVSRCLFQRQHTNPAGMAALIGQNNTVCFTQFNKLLICVCTIK